MAVFGSIRVTSASAENFYRKTHDLRLFHRNLGVYYMFVCFHYGMNDGNDFASEEYYLVHFLY